MLRGGGYFFELEGKFLNNNIYSYFFNTQFYDLRL